nr:MAG TPA: hypothetical protein [Caudoviricetes sp.]
MKHRAESKRNKFTSHFISQNRFYPAGLCAGRQEVTGLLKCR